MELDLTGSHWIYPHDKTHIMNHKDPFSIVGVKLKIGALYAVGIKDWDINGILFLNRESMLARHSDKILSNTRCMDSTRRELDAMLCAAMIPPVIDRKLTILKNILNVLGDTPIAQLAEGTNCSLRTLERNCRATTGLTLKKLETILRLETIIDHLYEIPVADPCWCDIAHQFGFSDQSHFIRFIKHHLGEPPLQVRNSGNLTIDVYGNFQ